IIVWYRYKAGSGDYCDWVPIANEDVEQFEGGYETYVDVTGLDYTKAYTFQAKVGDCFVEVESATVKVKTVPVFDWSDEDFNFNVPVTMTEPIKIGGVSQDYIVKDGKSGAFTYRKWNSGKLEVYATKSQSTGSFNASGAIYVNANTLSIGNYPVAFVETPVTVATCYGVSGWLL
ncbi:MAG: hypothetical protein KBS91_02560, partial [Firmicutes bacterium]|nr:hypothetical protein [Candidatus Caballimonas caccae]